MTMPELAPGRIDLSAEDYHADRSAVAKSWLDRIDRTPGHLRVYLDGYRRETPAPLFGRLVHTAVLQPDLLPTEYITKPTEINRRTKIGKAEYAAWEKENAGRTIITMDQFALALAIRDSIYRNKAARALLDAGEVEQTIVWRNSETGELCKARADKLRESLILDVKTTEDARPDAFAKSIAKYRYHVQTTHYEEGFEADRFIWLAVEKEPPYACALYAADDVIRKIGKVARDRNLRTYAECKAKNVWPGYEEIIKTIELPKWAR